MLVVIDSFGKPFVLMKNILETFMSDYTEWASRHSVPVPGRNSMFYKEG